jgi:hypothetical protein
MLALNELFKVFSEKAISFFFANRKILLAGEDSPQKKSTSIPLTGNITTGLD